MANRLTQEFRALKEAPPGRRFESGFERTHVRNRVLRMGLVGLGVALMVTAAVTFWLPGPNFILVFAGLALIGGQSRIVARLMDRSEVTGRRWNTEHWDPYPHKTAVKVSIALVVVIGAALVAWVAWRQGWLPGWAESLVERIPGVA